jgi:hypothetical protein
VGANGEASGWEIEAMVDDFGFCSIDGPLLWRLAFAR